MSSSPPAPFEDLLARISRTVARSRELNERARSLGVVSKRLCRPRIRGGSDADPSRTGRTVDKTRRGGLPAPFNGKLWVGPGSETACSGCSERIVRGEREFETELSTAVTFRFHAECYRVWLAFGSGPDGADGGVASDGAASS